MNIAEVMNKIVQGYNDNDDCGLCWKFVFGGRQDYFNVAKLDCGDACCVTVGILRNSFVNGYKKQGDYTTHIYRDWNIQIFAGIPSKLDIQFYNEIDCEDTCGSKWTKYVHPIICCMDKLDVTICDVCNCEGATTSVEVQKWDAEVKLNFLDNNYDGWFINATLREWMG